MEPQDNDLRELMLAGITYHQMNAGAFVLVLQEVKGDRRLPIVIGTNEAQSIECKLLEIITPRPLTHDLMVNIFRAFGLQLKYVVIRRMESGVYAADLHLRLEQRSIVIDARSSDAVAIAIRMGVPIYTTAALLDEAGVRRGAESDVRPLAKYVAPAGASDLPRKSVATLDSLPAARLQEMLDKAVEEERYEEAAEIKAVLDRMAGDTSAKDSDKIEL